MDDGKCVTEVSAGPMINPIDDPLISVLHVEEEHLVSKVTKRAREQIISESYSESEYTRFLLSTPSEDVSLSPIFGDDRLTKEMKMMFTVYIGEDGRITVPKGVRDALDIVEGDLVECTIRKIKRGT